MLADTQEVHTLWFNRTDQPIDQSIVVDLTGDKFTEIDTYEPGGASAVCLIHYPSMVIILI